ncbi:endothelial cell-specific chemotaxis regulator isoform X5 [Suricata suricatta]|uniref:endothelial cell-specific chemotaxis regulator isoform X5 n=1 Tax=Suricata suricatta TaxID=37032 RepID=UPI00115531A0|nr:endothelial cell-specific chemotaxis regulator isoform X5 [Suricata suricatta]
MGTVGATQLCWVILGFHLLQGHHSQPTTIQTSSLQGAFSSQNLTTEPLSYNTAAPEETSQVLEAASKPGTQNMSTVDGHSQALLGLTGSQPQKLASELSVISFIVILVVVVIILVSVVSLRFKCRKTKESEDPQKPGSSGLSESCSTANGEKESITLISMKNINMNNSKGCPPAEKVL